MAEKMARAGNPLRPISRPWKAFDAGIGWKNRGALFTAGISLLLTPTFTFAQLLLSNEKIVNTAETNADKKIFSWNWCVSPQINFFWEQADSAGTDNWTEFHAHDTFPIKAKRGA